MMRRKPAGGGPIARERRAANRCGHAKKMVGTKPTSAVHQAGNLDFLVAR